MGIKHRQQVGAWVAAVILACGITSLVEARPIILEEVARITSPDPRYRIDGQIGLTGRDLLVVATDMEDPGSTKALVHFERQSNGTWLYRGVLTSGDLSDQGNAFLRVRDGLAVFVAGRGPVDVLERTTTGWRLSRFNSESSDVAIYGSDIAVGNENGDGYTYVTMLKKDATGVWRPSTTLQGPLGYGDNDFLGPEYVELGANELTVGSYNDSTEGAATFLFERINGQWTRTDVLETISNSILVDGKIALGRPIDQPGQVASFVSRLPTKVWGLARPLLSDERFIDKDPAIIRAVGEGSNTLAIASSPSDDARGTNAGSIGVFRTENYGYISYSPFVHAATLFASDAKPEAHLGAAMAADGLRVAASSRINIQPSGLWDYGIYIFELPNTLPASVREQRTFEDLNSAEWLPWGTTTWRVVASNGSNVFRQSNTQGDARAIFETVQGKNVSIQADLKVNSFGTRGWVGLMTRYTDASNFYYLMTGVDSLQIREMVNGTFSAPIASTPFAVQVGRNYRFRFEAIGTRLRAYVDDKLMLDVRDTTHTQGRTGLTMWKANADFDNAIVSSSPYTTLHADTFAKTIDEWNGPPWTTSGTWALATSNGATVYRQSFVEGDARAVQGSIRTEDQIIRADVRIRSFSPTRVGFAGLIARYRDNDNYYYVTLTESGRVSLRRWYGRQITVLDEQPFTVTPGVLYRLRFEVIGDQLRLYVNDRLYLEGQDDRLNVGRYGLVTYGASADFDSFNASRP